jgi:hypothetical protein
MPPNAVRGGAELRRAMKPKWSCRAITLMTVVAFVTTVFMHQADVTLSCKSFVKPKRFPSRLLRKGSVLRFRLFLLIDDCKGLSLENLDGIRLSRRRSGILQSFLSCAIAPKPFLREVPLTFTVRSSAS